MNLDFKLEHKTGSTPVKTIGSKTWYALSTASRAEKKLCSQLREAGIDAYLPLQICLRQWKDRKRYVEIPLFPSYLFVNIFPQEYYKVLNYPAAVRFICFNSKAVPIPEKQIEAIRHFLQNRIPMEVYPGQLQKGTRVRVKEGLLVGLEAEITDIFNKESVVLRIDAIQQNIIVHIPVSCLESLH